MLDGLYSSEDTLFLFDMQHIVAMLQTIDHIWSMTCENLDAGVNLNCAKDGTMTENPELIEREPSLVNMG